MQCQICGSLNESFSFCTTASTARADTMWPFLCHPLGTEAQETSVNEDTLATVISMSNRLILVSESRVLCLLLAPMKLWKAN